MKSKFFLLLAAAFILNSCKPLKVPLNKLDTLEKVTLFETSVDYFNRNPMKVNAGVIIKSQSNQHITVTGIFDLTTGLLMKKELSAWAIQLKGNSYFNLGYSDDVNHWNSYAKFDIEGRYSLIIIDDNSPPILHYSSVSNGGGISGFIMSESRKWGKNWRDEKGLKKKILIIDNKEIEPKFISRHESSVGNYLTKKKFDEIVQEHKIETTDSNLKKISFLELLKVFNKVNEQAEN